MQHTRKSSLHSLILFLPLFCQLPMPETLSILCCNCWLQISVQFSAKTANSWTRLNSVLQLSTPELNSILILAAWDPHYIVLGSPHGKHHLFYCCMLIHCCRDVFAAPLHSNAAQTTENTALLLLRAFNSVGMCLPSCCLSRNYSGFQASSHYHGGCCCMSPSLNWPITYFYGEW
jgi:hypothetical protein